MRKELEYGGLTRMLYELLDNARRSGATRIAIDIVQHETGSRVSVEDNGKGLAEPQPLVEYGCVEWGDAARENAQGIGFLALAGAEPEVASRKGDGPGWSTVLTPAEFASQRALPATPDESIEKGTRVTFKSDINAHQARQMAADVARYQTLDVYIDGTHARQSRYTNGALARDCADGYQFAVFPTEKRSPYDLNAHGRLVFANLPTVQTAEGKWSIRAELEAWPEELVVETGDPPRLVGNNAAKKLRLTAERVLLAAMANAAHGPAMETAQIARAAELGITIPGRPRLGEWAATICEDEWPPFRHEKMAVPEDALIVAFETEQPARDGQMLARANESHTSEKPVVLVEPDAGMQGQAWYDRLERITSLRALVSVDGVDRDADDEDAWEWRANERRVDSIRLELTVARPDGSSYTRDIPTDVALGGGPESYNIDGKEMFLTAGSTIDVEQLATLIEASSCGRYDDDRGDSREAQARDFTMRASYRAARALLDEAEADRQQIATAVRNELLRRIEREPLDETILITIKGHSVSVEFEADAA